MKDNKLDKLIQVKEMIESENFQEFFVKPIKEKIARLQVDFFQDDLKENWRKGGLKQGLEEFIGILKQIDTDYKNEKFEQSSKSKI